jgi:hypothetical protein
MANTFVGRHIENAEGDAEISLTLPHTLAPWDAANRVAVFLDRWLDKSLCERGVNAQDVSYIVNELMENAVKYGSDGAICISIGFATDGVVIDLSHATSPQRAEKYHALARSLVQRDPEELFMEIIEKNSAASDTNEAKTGAGLGLISLRLDYQAELSFCFQSHGDGHCVATQVLLPWPSL